MDTRNFVQWGSHTQNTEEQDLISWNIDFPTISCTDWGSSSTTYCMQQLIVELNQTNYYPRSFISAGSSTSSIISDTYWIIAIGY